MVIYKNAVIPNFNILFKMIKSCKITKKKNKIKFMQLVNAHEVVAVVNPNYLILEDLSCHKTTIYIHRD
jgi:hypothetical protein